MRRRNMSRHIAAALAFLFCAMAGVGKSRLAKKRCELLLELYKMLTGFEIKIRSAAPTISELIARDSSLFSSFVREQARGQCNIRTAWAAACERLEALPHCGREEALLMRQLGMELGKSDRAGEVSLIEMYLQQLSILCESARSEFSKKGAVFRSVGVLCGLGVAIMIW